MKHANLHMGWQLFKLLQHTNDPMTKWVHSNASGSLQAWRRSELRCGSREKRPLSWPRKLNVGNMDMWQTWQNEHIWMRVPFSADHFFLSKIMQLGPKIDLDEFPQGHQLHHQTYNQSWSPVEPVEAWAWNVFGQISPRNGSSTIDVCVMHRWNHMFFECIYIYEMVESLITSFAVIPDSGTKTQRAWATWELQGA